MENLLCTTDFKDIKTVYLVLGPECNMRCRHCHQTPEKDVFVVNQNPTDEVMQFLDNYIQFSQKQEYNHDLQKNVLQFPLENSFFSK